VFRRRVLHRVMVLACQHRSGTRLLGERVGRLKNLCKAVAASRRTVIESRLLGLEGSPVLKGARVMTATTHDDACNSVPTPLLMAMELARFAVLTRPAGSLDLAITGASPP
jgi:hypothetical protein